MPSYYIESSASYLGRQMGVSEHCYAVLYSPKMIRAGHRDFYIVAEFPTHADALAELRRLNKPAIPAATVYDPKYDGSRDPGFEGGW